MALFRRRSTPAGPQPADESGAPPADEGRQDASQAPASASDALAATDVVAAATDASDATNASDAQPGPVDALARYDRARGPFDETEMDRAEGDVVRLDLGSLLIPGLPGVGVQVEADPNTQVVRAITCVLDDGAVQLQVFAAPRTEGLWDEIRAGMIAEITSTANAQIVEARGAFGPEIRAVLPARSPEGKQVMQAVRFAGIDGPRWFLRAVFLGRAAVEPDPEDLLHELVRQTIVVRGTEAMAPQDPLPLRLPDQPVGDQDTGDQDTGDQDSADAREGSEESSDSGEDRRYADLDPFERGPEITETR